MIERFEKEAGRENLLDALRNQKLVGGDASLARDIAEIGNLVEVKAGTAIITQDTEDTDVFFILAGAFDILVHGRRVARRFATDHVGEMAAIQSTQKRSATVIATETSVLCHISGISFNELGRKHVSVWRRMSKELARRLEQRNAHVLATHIKTRIFIISSAEGLEIARAIQNALDYDCTVTLWTDGVFRASWYPIESLEKQLDRSDFAIAVAQPDDFTESRGSSVATPRDNVIFELGLFIGRIGRQRSFLVEPRGEEVKLPTDFSGITALTYRYDTNDLASAMGPVCNKIREIVRDLGPNN
jgi:CRP/FNR family cyclic AMP-dependent transcriptional regulator